MICSRMMAESLKNQDAVPLSGNLEDVPFARIFYLLAKEKRTGFLDILTAAPPEGKVVKRVVMLNGSNFYIQGGAADETLARILVSQGKLSEEKYQGLKDKSGGDYKKLDELALEAGGVNGPGLGELFQFQTELKLKNCFALIRGFYQFRESDGESVRKYLLAPISPEKIMLAAVAANYPKARMDKEFAGIAKKRFLLKPELNESINLFGFGPKEQRWLRGLGKELVFAHAVQASGLKPEDAGHILLALYFAGYLELAKGEEDFPFGRAFQEAVAKAKKVEEKKPAAEEKKEEKKEVKKEEPKLPIEEILDKDMSDQELLSEIDKMLDMIAKKEITFFDIMGVDERTPSAHIKRIYFKMAKVFHPDAKPELYKGEIREKVEDLFTKIGEAYNTLTEPDLRKQYVDRLKSKVSDAEMEKANRAIQAEMEFQKATIAIRRGGFKDAVSALDAAIGLMPDEPEYKIHLGYCLFKTQGVGSAAKSGKMIEDALRDRPKVAEGWFYLGVISRVQGEMEKARGYFLKALELDKYHQESQRELRVLEMKLAEKSKKKR